MATPTHEPIAVKDGVRSPETVNKLQGRKQVKGYRNIFELASLLLAVLAILFAVLQYLDSKRLEAHITQIAQSMSTAYVGEFPNNIKEINRVVSNAKKELDIVADVPGYGQYSRPKESDDYIQTLLNLRPQADIRMLIYDEPSAKASRKRQFASQEFAKLTTTSEFKHYFEDVWPTLEKPKNKEEFMEDLQQKQNDYEKLLLQKHINIRRFTGRLMFNLWLQDHAEAILSFEHNAKDETQVSFRTRDGNMIATFQNTFDQLWSSANK